MAVRRRERAGKAGGHALQGGAELPEEPLAHRPRRRAHRLRAPRNRPHRTNGPRPADRALASVRGLGRVEIDREPGRAIQRHGDGQPPAAGIETDDAAEPPAGGHPPRERPRARCRRGRPTARTRENLPPGRPRRSRSGPPGTGSHRGSWPRAAARAGRSSSERMSFNSSSSSTPAPGRERPHPSPRARPLRNPSPARRYGIALDRGGAATIPRRLPSLDSNLPITCVAMTYVKRPSASWCALLVPSHPSAGRPDRGGQRHLRGASRR